MLVLLKTLIYYPFLNILTFFIWLVPGHYAAWGIVFLTLVVRIILIIPSKRAAQAQRRIAQVQPLMEELKLEYGTDKQGLAAAQMELYKKNNINPFGSCLISLIQIPILYILYYTILRGLAPHNPHIYSWVPQPAFINPNFFGINLLQPDIYFIIPGAVAILQFIQMKMMLPANTGKKSTDPGVAMQRQMVYFMPLLLLLFARRFPAGVALYYATSTLFTIAQQYYVNKERLKVDGVDRALVTAEKLHPETHHLNPKEKTVLESKVQKGVSVTVRKKG